MHLWNLNMNDVNNVSIVQEKGPIHTLSYDIHLLAYAAVRIVHHTGPNHDRRARLNQKTSCDRAFTEAGQSTCQEMFKDSARHGLIWPYPYRTAVLFSLEAWLKMEAVSFRMICLASVHHTKDWFQALKNFKKFLQTTEDWEYASTSNTPVSEFGQHWRL